MTWYRAEDADVLFNVQIGTDSSVFYHAVLRGDDGVIRIADRVNIQDGCILHATAEHPLTIQDGTSIGHGAILHGCHIGRNCLIGMGSIIMDGAVIEDGCIVGAGALVTENKHFERNSLILGSPARSVRTCTEEETDMVRNNADHYVRLAHEQLLPVSGN